MEILDKKFKGTTWSNGKFPGTIVFDNLKEEQIPFLKHIGMGFLAVTVCDKCEKERCVCNRIKKTSKKVDDISE